jgi:hypothetical protein
MTKLRFTSLLLLPLILVSCGQKTLVTNVVTYPTVQEDFTVAQDKEFCDTKGNDSAICKMN